MLSKFPDHNAIYKPRRQGRDGYLTLTGRSSLFSGLSWGLCVRDSRYPLCLHKFSSHIAKRHKHWAHSQSYLTIMGRPIRFQRCPSPLDTPWLQHLLQFRQLRHLQARLLQLLHLKPLKTAFTMFASHFSMYHVIFSFYFLFFNLCVFHSIITDGFLEKFEFVSRDSAN